MWNQEKPEEKLCIGRIGSWVGDQENDQLGRVLPKLGELTGQLLLFNTITKKQKVSVATLVKSPAEQSALHYIGYTIQKFGLHTVHDPDHHLQ